MKAFLFVSFLFISLGVLAQDKQVAITVDDLPFAYNEISIDNMEHATRMLLSKFEENGIKATGFINGQRIYRFGEMDRRIALLQLWLDSGNTLGSHTYSHPSLNNVSLDSYKENFLRNENVLDMLHRNDSSVIKYFRYPYLRMGIDTLRKNGFLRFLSGRNYVVAPITIDNEDYIFNKVYSNAYVNNDKILQDITVKAYLIYIDEIIDTYEQVSLAVVGRHIKQIFLSHANLINAHHFSEVANVFKKRGYTFIPLNEALTDPVYQRNDSVLIEGGWSHLDRWKKEDGINVKIKYPVVDKVVMDAYSKQ